MMEPITTRRREPWRLPLVVALWLLIFVLSVTQYAASALLRGDSPDVATIVGWSSGWLVWIVLTAPVTWLTRRVPLDRVHLRSRLPIHVGGSIVASVVVIFIEAIVVLFAEGGDPAFATILGNMRRVVFYRFHVYVLVYWAVVAAVHALTLHDQARERELRASELEREIVEARLARLRGQLHPHFLFNTLNSVQALLLTGEPHGATKMISRLSDLLRMSLDDDAAPTHTLRRELEMIDLYLEIQKVRFEDRLRISVDVPDDLRASEVPVLILQPIVENCIEHAVSVDSSAGSIRLVAARQRDELRIEITDDGPGLDRRAPDGNGVTITRRRLQSHYGDAARLVIENGDTKGVRVTITLPWVAGSAGR